MLVNIIWMYVFIQMISMELSNFPLMEHITSELTLMLGPLNMITLLLNVGLWLWPLIQKIKNKHVPSGYPSQSPGGPCTPSWDPRTWKIKHMIDQDCCVWPATEIVLDSVHQWSLNNSWQMVTWRLKNTPKHSVHCDSFVPCGKNSNGFRQTFLNIAMEMNRRTQWWRIWDAKLKEEHLVQRG